jgi:hypothetical protein
MAPTDAPRATSRSRQSRYVIGAHSAGHSWPAGDYLTQAPAHHKRGLAAAEAFVPSIASIVAAPFGDLIVVVACRTQLLCEMSGVWSDLPRRGHGSETRSFEFCRPRIARLTLLTSKLRLPSPMQAWSPGSAIGLCGCSTAYCGRGARATP